MFTIYEDKPLRGSPEVRAIDLERWLLACDVDAKYAKLASTFVLHGIKYGIRGDVALCQSVLETGWFWKNDTVFDVKPSQQNFGGLGATGSGVPGDSFATPELGIEAQIQSLALRSDGKIAIDKALSAYDRKVYSTITGYHHTMWKQLAGTWAADANYWAQIQKLMAQYNAWAKANGETSDTTTPDVPDAPKPEVFAVSAVTLKGLAILRSFVDYAPMDFQIYNAPEKPPVEPPKPPTPSKALTGKRVWLDVGHGITDGQTYDSGCLGPKGEHEHVLNVAQYKACKAYLEARGCTVDSGLYAVKGQGVSLVERGRKGKGYDCMVSIHLNATNKIAEYSVAFVQTSPTKLDQRLGDFVAGETCKVKNEKSEGGANWTDYSVLIGAAQVNVPCCISEGCFLDSPGEVWPDDAPKFGEAIGKGIEKFLLSL